jgi:hypothetical protein
MNPALIALLGELLQKTLESAALFRRIKEADPAAWAQITARYPAALEELRNAKPDEG